MIKFFGNFVEKDLPYDNINTTIIGNDVWIGTHATILKGITIGDGSVIGAGCVLTKDVPPYSIVVGVPGKIIGYRFSDEDIKYLLKIKWWEFERGKIQLLTDRRVWSDINELKKVINSIK